MKTIKRYKGIDNRLVYDAGGSGNIHRPKYYDELLRKVVFGMAFANNYANWLNITFPYDVTGTISEVLNITCEVPYDFVEYPVNPNWTSIW